ncbi:MAG: hypothetical protein ACPGO3_10050 [Magnetospiraceae bacterium]
MTTMEHGLGAKTSRAELAEWKASEAVYYRNLSNPTGGSFAVYAADGTFLDTADSMDEILEVAFEEGIEILTVH